MQKVFVYGTLLEGCGNDILLKDSIKLCDAETTPDFTMYSLCGFPGVLLDGETVIKGEVYEVTEDVEESLDSLEGASRKFPEAGLYRREFINLPAENCSDGEAKENVLIYIINNRYFSDDSLIESGDWRKYDEERRKKYVKRSH